MITENDLYRAGNELARAEARLAAARPRRWTSPSGRAEHKAAEEALTTAQTALDDLTARHEAQQQFAAERPAREKAAAKDITAAGKELDASRKKLAEAATAAQQALLDLADAAEAHNALIGQHSAALTVRGLALEEGQDHATGGGRDGLRLRGAWWMPVEVGALLAWVAFRVGRSKLGSRHELLRQLDFFPGRRALDGRSDGLLDGVAAAPEPKAQPRLLRPERPRLTAPVGARDVQAAEQSIRGELLGWSQPVVEDGEVVGSKRVEAPEAVKASVERRIALLRERAKEVG